MSFRYARLLALAMFAAAAAFAQNLQPVPKLTARITDLTGTLTAEQQSSLDDKLAAFEAQGLAGRRVGGRHHGARRDSSILHPRR